MIDGWKDMTVFEIQEVTPKGRLLVTFRETLSDAIREAELWFGGSGNPVEVYRRDELVWSSEGGL